MFWNTGDTWTSKIKFTPFFEFKFAVMYNDTVKKWEHSANRVFNFNAIKEVIIKSRNHKNIQINDKMSVSYDYTSKLMTILCKWQ